MQDTLIKIQALLTVIVWGVIFLHIKALIPEDMPGNREIRFAMIGILIVWVNAIYLV